MEILNNLVLGFSVAFTPIHLLYALIGVLLGTLIGVLPGIGPVATIAMLLPITFNLDPVAALIMLAGIYYGAQYGGSTTAILVNLPGESASVVTCLDGYQMARQGRAGPALATAAVGSFFAGCVATLIIAMAAPPLAEGALKFGTAEIIANLEMKDKREVFTAKVGRLMPTKEDIKRAWPAVLRGTALGSFLGILPGGGALLASFGAYTLEKKVSKHPEQFGKGAIEGVAGPEAANNAGAQTSFIPMLTLGIPGNAVMALMIGALMIQGIAPGPQVMTSQPELFWGVIASMWTGNLMLIVLNLPLIGLWVSLLRVPYRLMFPAIVLFCCIGTYSVGNSAFDVGVMLLFALLGVFFIKVGAEPAPFILGFILGPLMEENFRRAMMLSRGDPMVFLERPISAGLLILSA